MRECTLGHHPSRPGPRDRSDSGLSVLGKTKRQERTTEHPSKVRSIASWGTPLASEGAAEQLWKRPEAARGGQEAQRGHTGRRNVEDYRTSARRAQSESDSVQPSDRGVR